VLKFMPGLGLAIIAAGLAACGSPQKTTSLGKTYDLIDDQGRLAGKVVLNPLGQQGQVYDEKGNLVGNIVAP
jgi:hypothetical protein